MMYRTMAIKRYIAILEARKGDYGVNKVHTSEMCVHYGDL